MSTPAPASAVAPATPERVVERIPHRGLIMILVCSAFVVILNETVMSVALPTLMEDLGITARTGQWLTTAFLLTMAVVIPVTGFLLQRWTTRTIYLSAMVLFSAGTLIAGIAPGFEVLLLGRIVQAVGTAMMMPLLMTTILVLVPASMRGRLMGSVAIVMSVAPALGPTVAGLVLQFLSWRWIFFVVLPFAVVLLVVGALRMVNAGERTRKPLDIVSIPLSALGFGGLVFALSNLGGGAGHSATGEVADEPMPAGLVFGILGLGVVSLGLFVWRQIVLQRADRPLLDLRVFRHRTFTIGLLIMMIAFAALLGSAILLPMYMQQVRGLDTLLIGLVLLPGGVLMGVLGPIVGYLFDKHGARVLMLVGSSLVVVALFVISRFDETTPVWLILVAQMTMSGGLAFLFTPAFSASLGLLPPPLYSHGSAMLSTLQQVAGGAGTALLVAVASTVTASALAGGAEAIPAERVGLETGFLVASGLAVLAVVLSAFMPGRAAVVAAQAAAEGEGATRGAMH